MGRSERFGGGRPSGLAAVPSPTHTRCSTGTTGQAAAGVQDRGGCGHAYPEHQASGVGVDGAGNEHGDPDHGDHRQSAQADSHAGRGDPPWLACRLGDPGATPFARHLHLPVRSCAYPFVCQPFVCHLDRQDGDLSAVKTSLHDYSALLPHHYPNGQVCALPGRGRRGDIVGAAAQGTRCESGAVPQLSPGSKPPTATAQLGGKAGASGSGSQETCLPGTTRRNART